MTDTSGALPPAGWYPDPYGAPFERWWDGTGWTTHTNTPEAAVAPTPAAPEPAVAEPTTPEYGAPVQADPFANFATPSQQTGQNAFEQPVYQAPVTAQPAYQAPITQEPAYQAPAFEQPAYQAPVTQEPVYQAPVFEQPVYQAPVTQEPAYQAPVFEQPAYQAPLTQEPAYQPPVTQQPAFEQPAANPYPENLYRPGQTDEPPVRQPYDAQPFEQPFVQAPTTTPPPAAQAGYAGMPNPPSSFDFGFGPARTGDTGMPSNASIPADGDSGLFGSWAPNEYSVPPSNRPANAGLVFAVLSFIFSGVAGIVGLILSSIGLVRASQFAREGAGPVGRGKAIAGIVLSVVGSVASAALILYGSQLFLASLNAATEDPGTGQVTDDGTVTTANGGIPLAIGATGTIPLPGTETPAISFTVTSITPAFVCTAPEEDVESPDNGQFIAVKMDLTLSGDYLSAMDSGLPLSMSQSDWRGHSTDPTAAAIENTDTGLSCIPEEELFPVELSAGTTTSATVILDMATDTASVSWAPSGVTGLDAGLTRWEWPVV